MKKHIDRLTTEMNAMKAEALAKEKIKIQEEALLPKLELENSPNTNIALSGNRYQEHDFVFETHEHTTDLEF